MAHNQTENEIKLAVPDLKFARRKLHEAGFTISKRRVFESNVVFDTPRLTLRTASKLLRLRMVGKETIVTFKGKPAIARHKSREELELNVENAATIGAIFERLGFRPVFRYEKYRTEYRQQRGGGVATLDETPVGLYLELEGTPPWVDRTAHRMGFTEQDYITASYGRLYLDWCRKHRVKASNMVFG